MRLIRADGTEKLDTDEIIERLERIENHTRDSRDFAELEAEQNTDEVE